MSKFNYFFLLFAFALIFQSCLDNNDNRKEFYWNQTGCADPWQIANPGRNSEDQISNDLVAYLKDEGVRNARVERFTSDGVMAVCLACSCTTGVKIYIAVPKKFNSKMIELGFVET